MKEEFVEKADIKELQKRYDNLRTLLSLSGLSIVEFLEAANEMSILSVKISNYSKNNNIKK